MASCVGFKKAMLAPGEYESPDGTVEITKERLQHWAKQFARMSAAQHVVPADMDHPDDELEALPISSDEYTTRLLNREKRRGAETTVGRMLDFRYLGDEGAEVTLAICDPTAESRCDQNVVGLSPYIFDEWKDGDGNVFRDVITHMDIVVYPVDHHQKPFKKVAVTDRVGKAIACSALRFAGPGKATRSYRLSANPKGKAIMAKDDKEKDKVKDLVGMGDDATKMGSCGGGKKMGDDPMKPEDEEGDGIDFSDIDSIELETEEAPPEDALPPNDDNPEAMGEGDPEPGGASADVATQILADLEAAGIAAPIGVDPIKDPMGFLAQLSASLRQKKLMEPAAMGGMYGEGGAEEDEIITSGPEFAAMSTIARAKMSAIAKRSKALSLAAVKTAKQRLAEDVKDLVRTGRCTPAEAKARLAGLASARMSLGTDGTLKRTELHAWIEDRKTLRKGAVVSLKRRMSTMTASEHPEHLGTRAADPKRVNDDLAKRHPGAFA